jgi:hypothetical protein
VGDTTRVGSFTACVRAHVEEQVLLSLLVGCARAGGTVGATRLLQQATAECARAPAPCTAVRNLLLPLGAAMLGLGLFDAVPRWVEASLAHACGTSAATGAATLDVLRAVVAIPNCRYALALPADGQGAACDA